MRCPDCGADYPMKPEVVIQKESCKCGMTVEARITATVARCIAGAVVMIVLSMGSCTAYQSYLNMRISEKGDSISPNGSLLKPEKR